MKKSTIITLLVLLALTIASIFIYKNKNKTSTLNKEASEFSVKDTASIDKIFLADKEGKTITLTRKEDGWYLDDDHKARFDGVRLILETINAVSIKSPVSKIARENVIKLMAGRSTKVEIFSKGEKIKQYYVGHTTQDHVGTYMILTNLETDKNYEEPYITYIRGFEGFLSSRYHTDFLDWRDRSIMDFTPPQLKQIKVNLNEMKDSSFVIDFASSTKFTVKNNAGNILNVSEEKLKQYIAYYQNITCEIVLGAKDPIVDTISKQGVPFVTLSVTDINDKKNVCELYHKNPTTENSDSKGIKYRYDPDRIYIRFNDGKDFALAQYYVFGKLLQTYRYFLPDNTVKK